MNPVLLVIAGPNGSGKTTVTVRLRADQWSEGVEYLNPDDIARDLESPRIGPVGRAASPQVT
jgi:predicted ABC-type ATPase